MPRPRRSYGRRGTAVFPKDWAASHAPVAASNLRDVCAIVRPNRADASTFDKTTGRYAVPDYELVYTGPCRIEALGASDFHSPAIGDEQVTIGTHDLVIALGAGSDIRVDDLALTGSGAILQVRSLSHSTNSWDQRFACTHNQSTQQGVGV